MNMTEFEAFWNQSVPWEVVVVVAFLVLLKVWHEKRSIEKSIRRGIEEREKRKKQV